MVWTAPFTAVAGSVLTAAQLNTFIRDNLSETMPAKATSAGSIFTVGSTNSVVQRVPQSLLDVENVDVTATSFDAPATGSPGPYVTVFSGASVIVGYRALVQNASGLARVEMSYAISGATEREASTTRSLGYSVSDSASGMNYREGVTDLATLLEPGLNTFTLQYNVSSGTGKVSDRRIWAIPL